MISIVRQCSFPSVAGRWLGVWLLVGPFLLRAEPPAQEFQGSTERIECYQMALADLKEALNTVSSALIQAQGIYDDAVTQGEESVASASNTERVTLEALHKLYTEKLLDTMVRLAAEYEIMAGKLEAVKAYGKALEYASRVAETHGACAEVYEAEAIASSQKSGFDLAGQMYEKAYASYGTAQAKWQQALRLLKLLGGNLGDKEIRERIEVSAGRGVAALRAAATVYFSAYQAHREKATSGPVDIYSQTAGEEWRLAALAQQNHERVVLIVKSIEKTHQ